MYPSFALETAGSKSYLLLFRYLSYSRLNNTKFFESALKLELNNSYSLLSSAPRECQVFSFLRL